LYGGFSARQADLSAALIEGLEVNGLKNLVKMENSKTGQTMLYFGAMTVNNLPLLVELGISQDSGRVNVVFRVPVAPLRPLFMDSIRYILTR